MVPLQMACEEMGHPQPPSPIKCGNVTAQGIVNGTVKQKHSKTIDVRFYWLKDRISQQQFVVYWAPGNHNLGDYYTKHHPPKYVLKVRPIYTNQPTSPCTLLGCVEILNKQN